MFSASTHRKILFACSVLATSFAAADDGTDFFEAKIRPMLVDHCYECHSADSDEAGGGLLVDSRDGLLKGGETGPAIVPKNLEKSLLLAAIEYRDLEMPPNQKLDDTVIADVRKWIQMGAPDPRSEILPEMLEGQTVDRTTTAP